MNLTEKELLKQIDCEIHECKKCQNLVEKFPENSTIFLSKNHDILLVGEAPANNGWRKIISHGWILKERCCLAVLSYNGYSIF